MFNHNPFTVKLSKKLVNVQQLDKEISAIFNDHYYGLMEGSDTIVFAFDIEINAKQLETIYDNHLPVLTVPSIDDILSQLPDTVIVTENTSIQELVLRVARLERQVKTLISK